MKIIKCKVKPSFAGKTINDPVLRIDIMLELNKTINLSEKTFNVYKNLLEEVITEKKIKVLVDEPINEKLEIKEEIIKEIPKKEVKKEIKKEVIKEIPKKEVKKEIKKKETKKKKK